MTGLEVLCIKRSIDYLVTLDCVNSEKIGMMGLSYGGYFSLHTAAADRRIISAYDAGSFNDRSKTAFFDWGYTGASHKFHDAEVAALVAPRRLRIDVGKEDSVFDYRTSEPEAERITKYFEAYGVPENYSYDLHAGGHRFDENLEGFEYFFAPLE
jgi:dienelactone hydrolase